MKDPAAMPASTRAEIIKAGDPSAIASVHLLGGRGLRAPAANDPTVGRDPEPAEAERLRLAPLGTTDRLAAGPDSPAPALPEQTPPEDPSTGSSPDGGDGGGERSREIARLRHFVSEVVAQLIEERQRLMLAARDQVVELALAVARRIVRREIRLDRDVVARAVAEALARLNSAQSVRVRVNPSDLRAAEGASAPTSQPLADVERLEFVADPDVSPGGCIVETPSGIIEATVDAQFAQMERVLAAASGAVPYPDEA